MSEYTPGPWRVGSDSDRDIVLNDSAGYTVWPWVLEGGQVFNPADVALMAAAPDLLEAAQRVLGDADPHEAIQALRAAIVKATGGQAMSEIPRVPDVYADGAEKNSQGVWYFLHRVENAGPWAEMKAADRSRLIKAAPDLLEAVEVALEACDYVDIRQVLRRAIEKATGGQA